MKNFRLLSQLLAITAGILFFTSCQQEETLSNAAIDDRTTLVGSQTNINFYGLGPTNELYQYRSSPFTQLQATTISGLRDGELLLAIDSRPSTRQLYGITNQDALYSIRISGFQPFTAMATKITIDSFKPSLEGTLRAMDFDPSSGSIKVVTDSGQNLNIS